MDNMYPSKKNNCWVLCPSKSFPGKFYYFNGATGETAWCLNETDERKSLKNPPLQREDHCFPEPSSPPVEVTRTEPHPQPMGNFNSYNERMVNYPQDMYQNLSNNLGFAVQPYHNQMSNAPYQIQVPTMWPYDTNMPHVVMIVMNQAMRQLSIAEPKQGFRQQNYALEPNRAWKESNQVLELNRPWYQPNQVLELNQAHEPSRAWKEPNQVPEPNRAWKGPSQEPQQAPAEPKEPDRELFIHSGKAPLCKRFINFKKPVLEFKGSKVVRPSQYDLTTNKSNEQTSHNHSKDSPGPSKLNHDIKNQQENEFREPILNFAKEKEYSNPNFNFAKKSPEKTETSANIFMPSTSHSVSSPKNFPNLSQNFPKLNQGLLKQSQRPKTLFGQSQNTHQRFGQSISNNEVFKQGQTKHELFGQSHRNQELFGQSQTNQDHLWPSQTNKNLFGQSPTNKERFGQSLIKRQLIRPSQTCPEIFQSSNLESNPFQKLIAENSTLKQSAKVDFPISSKPNLEASSYFENDGTNAKQKTAFILDKEAEISKDQLDKNDLRRILLEKKRKSIDTSDSIEAKKIKTSMKQNPLMPAPKKKVTFNLDPETFSDSEHGDNSYKEMECQEETPLASESWYVVSDAEALLEDFNVLDGFVKSDPKCNLMIPSGVMSDIVALSRGECRERNLVTQARRLLRELATPKPHIILQQSQDVSLDISTNDSILNCCLEVMDNAYAMLITNDESLQTTAGYLSINCFTIEQIKNGEAKHPKTHFDTNKPEPMEIPIKKFENLSFGTKDWTNQKRSSLNHLEDTFNSYTTKAGETELNRSANDFENFRANSQTFDFQKDVRSFTKFNTTTLKQSSYVPYSNEITSTCVQNNGKQSDKGNIESENQRTTYFQKEKYKEETASTSFKQAKDKMKNKCLFKNNGIEMLPQEGQPRSPNFKSNSPQTKHTNVMFETEKHENQIFLSKPSLFGKENPTHKVTQSRSIFDGETSLNQSKTPEKEKNVTAIKNPYLERLLKRFCEKNITIECLVEERKFEIGCSFKQIMEECLNNVLQKYSVFIEQKHKTTPPWTFSEALECMLTVYSNHTYIRDVVSIFTSVLNADHVPARVVIRAVGCGMALVKYLMFISPTTDILKDTEDALNNLLLNVTVDVDMEPLEPTAPDLSSAEVGCVESNKRNFVKGRSYIVKYLKKHFAAWADYDETLEENANWGKKYKDNIIVRTYGKNLGMLKLNNTKAMTMEPDSSQNVDDNAKSNQNGFDNAQRNVNFGHETETENMDVESIISNGNLAKDNFDLKLTRIVRNTPAKVLKDNADSQKLTSTQENQNNQPKQNEPKVIRLCGNIDFTKENAKKVPEKLIFDDFSTHGHTFGRIEQNGPKVSINIKPIKEFEEKLKIEQKSLDLDEMDYSVMSKSDENNNLASESTNNNCLSMSLENKEDSKQKCYIDAKNDCLDGKNDSLNANDSHNRDSNHNSSTTNNESQPMSLEKSITVNDYGTIDLDDILASNYINEPSIDNIFDSNFDNYGINYNYDIGAMNDDFKKLNHMSFEANDVLNDMMVQKDDMTNDSGYENASQQAYYVIDTFLFQLKVAYKLMHTFLRSSVRELRSGQVSITTRHIISDTATMANAHLNKIMENLDGIIRRETSSGPKLKEMVAGAGPVADSDERIHLYREIVTKCYSHARQVEKALKAILSITDDRRL